MERRLYDSQRWRKVRRWWLKGHPLCEMCQRQGRITIATVVDHIIPHHGDPTLFWDANNYQSLCAACHNSLKREQELHGYSHAAGVDGVPLDPNHPWNRGDIGDGAT